ncbi:AP-5 complex subunit mu-1-like [Dysidea avara]|uniref:AP-5 complex subunit mu-1-like n=1 Tax=Dysidea avara TaxID=196820 RepID=UPI00331A73E0
MPHPGSAIDILVALVAACDKQIHVTVANNLIFRVVALVESAVEDKLDVLEIPSIPVALSLLEGIAELIGTNTEAISQSHYKMMELYQYLCVVAPFGSLLDNSVSNTKLLMANGYPQGPMPRQKGNRHTDFY